METTNLILFTPHIYLTHRSVNKNKGLTLSLRYSGVNVFKGIKVQGWRKATVLKQWPVTRW